jgi:methyl-accepting chemotaxis protein
MVSMLANFRIGDSGFVFMTDGSGKVKLHPDAARIDRDNLTQLASGSAAPTCSTSSPLPPPTPSRRPASDPGQQLHPLLDWYLVAQVPEAEIMPNWTGRLHMVLVSLAIAVGMGLLGILLAGLSRPSTNWPACSANSAVVMATSPIASRSRA